MIFYRWVKTNLPTRVSVWSKEYIAVWHGRPSRMGDIDISSCIWFLSFGVFTEINPVSIPKGKNPLDIPVLKMSIKQRPPELLRII